MFDKGYTNRKKITGAYIDRRKAPVNLTENDKALFDAALEIKIEDVYLYEIKAANILKDTIFDLSNLKFYTFLTHLFKVSAVRQFKKLKLYLFPYSRIPAAIWITDEWSREYFHWLTDALTRLTAIEAYQQTRIVLLPCSYKNISYVTDALHLLNYQVHYYNPKRRLIVDTLYLAGHTAPPGNYNRQVINKLRDEFSVNFNGVAYRKIYISRQKATKRNIVNEAEVQQLVLAHGYEVHFFEEYPLTQQIEILNQTKVLVGLHGAGLTNMLFMPAGGNILELRNEGDARNNCFFALAADLGHNYFYQTDPGSSIETYHADLPINIIALEKNLRQVNKYIFTNPSLV